MPEMPEMQPRSNGVKLTTALNIAVILGVGVIGYWTRSIEKRLDRIEQRPMAYVSQYEMKEIKRDILDRLALTDFRPAQSQD